MPPITITPLLRILSRPNPYPNFLRPQFGLNLRRSLHFQMAAVGPMSPPAGIAAAEGSMAKRFWFSSRKEALFAAYTPYVISLACGKLGIDVFRGFVAQDVHFLEANAKAYEMAQEYADDDDAKAGLCRLRRAVLDDLKLHDSVMKDWGIVPAKEITPIPATVKYTEFLLATASGKIQGGKGPGKIVTPFEKTKIAAYTVGALTSCMRLYAFLGRELKLLLGQDSIINHPYRKWIEDCSSDKFERDAQEVEELLDRLSVTLTGEELQIIEKLYVQAMRLEVEFFEAQPVVSPVVVPFVKVDSSKHFVIFSDFDLTCTVLDSSAVLAEIAILTAQKAIQTGVDSSTTQKSPSDVRSSWNDLSKRYAEEYEQCIERILSSGEAKGFDYDSLYKSLEMLSDFEKLATARVIDSGLLKGLKADDIVKTGGRLNLQDGCKDFFQKVAQRNEKLSADLHILSYCWCADLVRSTFLSVGILNALSIHANEFNYEASISTGSIIRKIESPIDKVITFKGILSNLPSDKKHLSVYIGDSVGDLLCLLHADVGIVIGSSENLRRVGEHFGVSFIPLYQGLVNKQRQLQQDDSSIWKGLSGVLYTVSSWLEIEAFLLGA